jgi:enoyl-[acyl-carrier protein] reductase II
VGERPRRLKGTNMKTRLTELLGIEHPVMLAGMGGVSYHQLAAAVSNAGGIGTLGAGSMSFETMVDEIAHTAALTDRPFGVDLLTAMPGEMRPAVEAIIEGGARIFVGALGVPTEVIDLCHDHDVLVVNMCGKVKHAVRAVDAGCDLVVAQGTEAGGHTGLVATLPLVPQIVDAVGDRVPVVAAGGIFDGRGLAAALSLGADGIWVGTRFIATPEARSVKGYKDALIASAEDGTTISRAYSGKPMRVVANGYTEYFDSHPEELQPFPNQMARSFSDNALHLASDPDVADIDVDKECYPAGQGAGAIGQLTPAADIVAELVTDAEAALARVDALR